MTFRTKSGRRRLRLAVPVLVLALLAGACTSSDDDAGSSTPPTTATSAGVGSGPVGSGESGTGATASPQTGTGQGSGSGNGSGVTDRVVGVRLSQGAAAPAEPTDVVDGDALPADRIKAIIDRLPTWDPAENLTKPFAWPTQTLRPPAGGTEVDQPFPPKDPGTEPPKDPDATGPLKVLRYQPEGAVAIAPFASITFSQPMVPIGTVGQVQAGVTVPATISPAVPGHWEWIGTQTLRFVGDSDQVDRLPMATEYTVTVPAGTKSATGATLAEQVSFRFSTPAVSVKTFSPKGSGLPLQPVFVAVFDQQIDADAVLATTTLTADDADVAVRPATAAEVEADEDATQAVSGVPDGRWLAFRPEQPLTTDTPVTVTFAKGTPSAEGPTTTSKPITFSGRTYGQLSLTKVTCLNYENPNPCHPGAPIQLIFTNTLDPEAFDADSVTVTPALAGRSVQVYEKTIVISGDTQPNTTYTVTVPADVTDVFGQALGSEQSKTVEFGTGSPRLDSFAFPLTTLDPLAEGKSVSVHSVGRTEFRLRVFAVTADQWPEYSRFYRDKLYGKPRGTVAAPDWPVLTDEKVAVDGADGKSADTVIDLADELAAPGVAGHLVALVEPTDKDAISENDWWQNQPTATWVQSTNLGIDAWTDPGQVRVWATDLRTGKPLPSVSITPMGTGDPVTTDADGGAEFDLTAEGVYGVIAERDGETAVLPADMWMSTWQTQTVADDLRWFVNDDRQTYRPGETASVKGWIRMMDADARLQAVGEGKTVQYTARDQMGNDIGHGTVDLGRLGGFDFAVKIPAGAALGATMIELQLTGSGTIENNYYTHSFTVADFRTPDFEVTVQPADSDPHVADSPFTLDADAGYYAGGPLGAAAVAWQVRTAPATYSPPGWDSFTFGIWTPWWLDTGHGYYNPYGYGYGYDMGYPQEPEDAVVDEFDGTTDAQGAHHLQVEVGDLGEKYDGLPATVTAQATVTDVNRQALAGTTDVLVHPADYYVGLSSETTFVRKGDPLTVSAIVTDIDGKATAGRAVQVRAAQVTTTWVNGQPEETESESDIQACSVTSGTEAVSCTFKPASGGSYRITATVTDDAGRHSRSQLTRWVSGATASEVRYVEQESVTLVPDKAAYAPGDTATVLVQSPITTGTGRLTIGRVGITSTRTFEITDGSAVLEIPVAGSDIPTINVSVEVVGTTPRTGPDGEPQDDAAPRPAFAAGQLALAVSTASRELDVDVVPRDATVEPGGSTTVDVTVRDADGKPLANSEFELVVVDEAVLALGGYDPVDPLDIFYADIYSRVQATYGRSTIALGQQPQGSDAGGPATSAAASAAEAGGQAAPAAPTASYENADGDQSLAGGASPRSTEAPLGTPITERTDFDPLAVFEPSVTTDANGKAAVEVDLPDNLTRYRVLAVAVDNVDRFGTGESIITAALPLTVRPTAPRFLNFGDTFELPVVVQNTTDKATAVDVVVQAANLDIELAGKQVTVPAGDRVEVRFPMSTAAVGTGRLRVAAVSDDPAAPAADAATVDLPVYTPSTSETFAGYGVIDSDTTIEQPLLTPTGVIPEFGGLQVTTSSTALANLTDAVLYLTDYPYESSDGLASQVLAIATLGKVLQAFEAPGLPSPEKLTAAATDKIAQLVAMQNEDGGWPYWQKGRETAPFNSVLVTQALAVAATQGFTVPKDTLTRATAYLKDIRSHLPAEMSRQDKDTVVASALNARMEAGDRDAKAANALVSERGATLPLDALAWLWPVVDDPAAATAIDAKVKAAVVDTAGAVTFTESVDDGDWTLLRSDRRTDALILDALVRVQPDSDLIPKAVAGLMAGQVRGRWETAQENTVALVALKRYFDTFEATPADFVAKVWLDDRFAGQHAFAGHSDEVTDLDIPTAELIKAGDTGTSSALTLSNDGTGRLYYRIGLQTAPADFDLDPLDRGFVVTRTYEAVDDPADVTRDADGTWRIRAGALVRVKLAMVARSQRTGVALVDPVPAGLEILNPDLETTPADLTGKADGAADGGASGDVQPRCCWWGTWYDHENLRDDRAEAYASYLPAGDYEYRYLARATTPGTFVVPPTRAEEMYAPETFGRAGSDAVVVE